MLSLIKGLYHMDRNEMQNKQAPPSKNLMQDSLIIAAGIDHVNTDNPIN
jgi:hypothetical protein